MENVSYRFWQLPQEELQDAGDHGGLIVIKVDVLARIEGVPELVDLGFDPG